MFKRLSVIAAVFFLLAAFIIPVFAGTLYDEEKVIDDAKTNYGYSDISKTGDPIHYVTLPSLSAKTDENGYSYGFLTYGQPHGDQKDGQYRYIGYTYYGEDYTNMDFPADQFAGFDEYASRDWVSEPWYNSDVIASVQKFAQFPGDGDSKYYGNIVMGLIDRSYGVDSNGYVINWDTVNEGSNREFYSNIVQHVHILTPPTQYAWGMGRMWHRDQNGSLWYVTIPLYPDGLLDQPVLLVTPPVATVNVGGSQQYKATYYPKGVLAGNGQDVTKTSVWTVEDASIASIGVNTGLATGKDPGMTRVVATYTANGKTLQGTARLIVENQLNLIAVAIDPGVYGEADPGGEYTAAVDFRNDSGQALTGVPVGGFNRQYRAVLRDAAGNEAQYTDFAPGEVKTFYFIYHTPDAGMTRISGVIDTPPLEDLYRETSEEDNKVSFDVQVRDTDNSSPGDRRLNLQAYSQAGEDVYGDWHDSVAREPFTAKWTDEVCATLTIDRPTPPKGTLDWWEISWAKVTYPKQNPDFQFGDPLPPQGTITKAMNVPGRDGSEDGKENPPRHESMKATQTFQEDWGIDGAQIYNMIKDELMAEYPKSYPIVVDFKVTYQYSYIVCDEDGCWVETAIGSYTATAKESLLVNGTGKGIYAQ